MENNTITFYVMQAAQKGIYYYNLQKYLHLFSIKSPAQVLQDSETSSVRSTEGWWHFCRCRSPARRGGGRREGARCSENSNCRKKGDLSSISETLEPLLQIPRHKTDGTATKLEPGLLALPLGLTPIIHL